MSIHEILRWAATAGIGTDMVDVILAHCPDAECVECSRIICPHRDPFHFHHDGCPSCEREE